MFRVFNSKHETRSKGDTGFEPTMRKSPPITITITPGNADLETLRAAVLRGMAADLAETMRRLLADGHLVIRDGRIIPNPERTKPT